MPAAGAYPGVVITPTAKDTRMPRLPKYDLCWIGDHPGKGALHVLESNGRALCENHYGANYYHLNARHIASTVTDAHRQGLPTCTGCNYARRATGD